MLKANKYTRFVYIYSPFLHILCKLIKNNTDCYRVFVFILPLCSHFFNVKMVFFSRYLGGMCMCIHSFFNLPVFFRENEIFFNILVFNVLL